jgi:hypothetical protein
MKHMNATRFNFFLYIILNEHNILKSTGNFNNSFKYKSFILASRKQKFEEIQSEDD